MLKFCKFYYWCIKKRDGRKDGWMREGRMRWMREGRMRWMDDGRKDENEA